MLRINYKIVGFLAIIIMAIFLANQIWIDMTTPAVEILVYADEENNNFRNNINSVKTKEGEYHVVDTPSNAEIIIMRQSEKEIEGYTKHPNYFYSPIVMFANYTALQSYSGFDTNNDFASKDINIIIDGMMQGKTWKEVNLDPKSSDVVTMSIPSKATSYYQDVIDFIQNSLDKVDSPYKLNSVLDKMTYIESLPLEVETLLNKNKYSILIGPEYIVGNNNNVADSHSSCYVPIYPEQTTAIYWDVFIKTNENEERNLNSLSDEKVFKKMGLRCEKPNFDYGKLYSISPSVNIIHK